MNNKISLSILVIFLIIGSLIGCGDPSVDITSVSYDPRIVVEGYLFPGEPVKDIRIMRNFPLNQPIDTNQFFINPAIADVKINTTKLDFDSSKHSYFTNAFTVEKGQTYTLEVSATIDGKKLTTTASTTVPLDGLKLLSSDSVQHHYSEEFGILFCPMTPTGFYAFSIRADSAGLSNFIYDNEFNSNMKSDQLEKDLNNFRLRSAFIQNLKPDTLNAVYQPIRTFNTWFYSDYTVIMYAGDQNFKNFVLTAPSVKEFDGNFHEPKIIMQGSGAGVFASAIKDTIRFSIIR